MGDTKRREGEGKEVAMAGKQSRNQDEHAAGQRRRPTQTTAEADTALLCRIVFWHWWC
jgi:hypothetical protein